MDKHDNIIWSPRRTVRDRPELWLTVCWLRPTGKVTHIDRGLDPSVEIIDVAIATIAMAIHATGTPVPSA